MAILLTRKILRTLPNLQTLSLTKPSIIHPQTTQVVLTNPLFLNCEALKHLPSVSKSTPVLECLRLWPQCGGQKQLCAGAERCALPLASTTQAPSLAPAEMCSGLRLRWLDFSGSLQPLIANPAAKRLDRRVA